MAVAQTPLTVSAETSSLGRVRAAVAAAIVVVGGLALAARTSSPLSLSSLKQTVGLGVTHNVECNADSDPASEACRDLAKTKGTQHNYYKVTDNHLITQLPEDEGKIHPDHERITATEPCAVPTQTFQNDYRKCSWTDADAEIKVPDAWDNAGTYIIANHRWNQEAVVTPAPANLLDVKYLVGETDRPFTADDGHDNTAECTFDVIVQDTEKPYLIQQCPDNVELQGDTTCSASYTWDTPQFEDNCHNAQILGGLWTDGVEDAVSESVTEEFQNLEVKTRTYSAKDGSENQNSCFFTVQILDVIAPILRLENIQIKLTEVPAACLTGMTEEEVMLKANTVASTTDNCINNELLNYNYEPNLDLYPVNVPDTKTDVKVTAHDGVQGTSGDVSVTVSDLTQPVYTACQESFNVSIPASSHQVIVSWEESAMQATDNQCGVAVARTDDTEWFDDGKNHLGETTPALANNVEWGPGMYEVIYVAVDLSGNSETCKFDIIVKDVTAPLITGCPSGEQPGGITVDSQQYTPFGIASWVPMTAWDVVDHENLVVTHLPHQDLNGYAFPIGRTELVYSATDRSGNTEICLFHVTVVDKSDPFFDETKIRKYKNAIGDFQQCDGSVLG